MSSTTGDTDDDAPTRTELERWYDDQFDPTDSVHTDLGAVPDVADIHLGDGTVMPGRSLSFLIERAMLDPKTTVVPSE